MQNFIKDLLPEFLGAMILGLLTYLVSLFFPGLDDNLRLAIAGGVVVMGLIILLFIGQRLKRLRQWLCRKWRRLLDKTKKAFASLRTRFDNFTACLRGELETCRNELQTVREMLDGEEAEVAKAASALTTLSQYMLSLFDMTIADDNDLNRSSVSTRLSHQVEKCAKSAQYHHVTKVVYYDPMYPASWVHNELAEQTKKFFVDRWFKEKDAQELRDWISQVIREDRAYKSLVVFAQDVVPDTVAEVSNETCLLRRYLDAGGRVVWRGDVPFWYQGKPSGAKDEWGLQGPQRILGIDYTNLDFTHRSSNKFGGRLWDQDLPTELTPAGYDIGLSYPRTRIRIRPVPGQCVTTSYLVIEPGTIALSSVVAWDADNLALCWKKNFNPNYRHGGFMQYITGEFLPNDVNDYFFRFAVSGWPLFFGS